MVIFYSYVNVYTRYPNLPNDVSDLFITIESLVGSKRPTAWSFRLNSYMQRWTPSANSSRSCGSSMVSTAKAHETFATSKRSTTSYGHGIGVWHWDALGLHSKPYDISILHTQGPQFDQPNSLGLSESRILQNPTVDHQTLPIEMTISGGTSLTCAP